MLYIYVEGLSFVGVQHGYCLSMLVNHLKPGMSVLNVGFGSCYLMVMFAFMVRVTFLPFSPSSHLWWQ
jgi:hypothetical protein